MIPSSISCSSLLLIIFVLALSILLSAPQPELDIEILLLAGLPLKKGNNGEYPLKGQVVAITGVTSGIGLELARTLSTKFGATIIGLGRSSSKLDKLKQEGILEQAFLADFSDLDAIATASRQMIETVPKIDILVNNAGMFPSPSWEPRTTKQGYDWTFGGTHGSPYPTNFIVSAPTKPDQFLFEIPSA